MVNKHQLFLQSALTADSKLTPTKDILPWFWEQQESHRYVIEQIPFSSLDKWDVDPQSGNIFHESGKFFSIEGLQVNTNYGARGEWQQPIINQPEIGILGIITKQIDGILHFLMQVKMEPGNINMVQLSPTLQATRSNYTLIHQGKTPPYLDYFFDLNKHQVLIDSLQSEQGGRFLRKRNRNIIIEVEDSVPVYPGFRWLTLGQIHQLLRVDNIVNMDTRTVLGCIPFSDASTLIALDNRAFNQQVLNSAIAEGGCLHNLDELRNWFIEQKFRFELKTRRIPMNNIEEWEKTEFEIHHIEKDYFSIIACRVEAASREVFAWTQPLIKTYEPGLVAFVARRFIGVLHFLVQAKVEPGIFDVVEVAPTVQYTTGNYRRGPVEDRAPFLDYVLNASPEQIRYDVLLSEEGGRFYREANRNVIIEVGDDFPAEVPSNYIWMTLRQLKDFVQFSNILNVECRCLMSCLTFLDSEEISL